MIFIATLSVLGKDDLSCYLLDVRVQLEYLSLPFHLPDTDLTGELRHSQAASLQAEGAVQGSLTAAPNVIERYLLSHKGATFKKKAGERIPTL